MMAQVTFSELRDDRVRFDASFQDLPILTRNLIMNRYREDPACMKQSYAKQNSQEQAVVSVQFVLGLHDLSL